MITVASFFQKENWHGEPTSISNSSPRWFKGPTIPKLCPGRIVWELKAEQITKQEYTNQYLQHLDRLDEEGFDWNTLNGKTLLCWEPTRHFCHRVILAEFLQRKGYQVLIA